jgi:hypothetical protein
MVVPPFKVLVELAKEEVRKKERQQFVKHLESMRNQDPELVQSKIEFLIDLYAGKGM